MDDPKLARAALSHCALELIGAPTGDPVPIGQIAGLFTNAERHGDHKDSRCLFVAKQPLFEVTRAVQAPRQVASFQGRHPANLLFALPNS